MAYRKRTYRKRSRTYRRRRAYKKYPRATMYRSPKGILSTKRTYLLNMSPPSYPANQMISPPSRLLLVVLSLLNYSINGVLLAVKSRGFLRMMLVQSIEMTLQL